MTRVLAAIDKFKGTATSGDAGAAVVRAARRAGCEARAVALSDGGDGLLEVFGGPNRHSDVTGPLGRPERAGWRLDDGLAVIESALASGLGLAGGAACNDPVAATSRGTGELVDLAVLAGAERIVVGVGGSATTDGGIGAVDALSPETVDALRARVDLVVCCDVATRYRDAARVFAPQKGATPEQVDALTERLGRQRVELSERFGVDVAELAGSGAAGGLAGGLAAVGAHLVPGFDVVAREVGLRELIAAADLVITGEGRLDVTSFDGKVVGGVSSMALECGTAVSAIVGRVDPGVVSSFPVVSLVEMFGADDAMHDVLVCLERATTEVVVRDAVERHRSE